MAAMAQSMVVPVVAGMASLSLSAVGSPSVQQQALRYRSSTVSVPRIGSKTCELRSRQQKTKVYSSSRLVSLTVSASDEIGSAAGAAGDSIVSEVAVLEEEPATPGVVPSSVATKVCKGGGVNNGGTPSGKRPSSETLGNQSGIISQGFQDPGWVKGTWDLSTFTKDGKVNWDGVIDAEVKRRKWLEDNPEASSNNEPVVFETSTIPWWAWVKRFHLPEAELLNGRAAMVGYFAAYLVDSATGVGLVDQQSSFLGKLLLFITIVGVLLVRKTDDLETLKALAKESTFYDKQWQASWKEEDKRSE